MEVLVFKTSVESPRNVNQLKPMLDTIAGDNKWNFALDDCDKILRVVSSTISPQAVIRALLGQGYHCAELED
jgi:hypothetical protein